MGEAEQQHHEREIERLTSKVAQLEQDLRSARKQLDDHKVAAWAKFKVGDAVTAERGSRRLEAVIRHVKPTWQKSFEYQVSFRRKDGTFSDSWQRGYRVEPLSAEVPS